jgi:hypothetical protein
MDIRASIRAACLVVPSLVLPNLIVPGLMIMGCGVAHAQAPAPGPNSAPTDSPAIDPTAKTPNTTTAPIPDVVKPSSQHGDVIRPRTSEDPHAVLNPPNVDPGMTVGRSALPGPAAPNGGSASPPK